MNCDIHLLGTSLKLNKGEIVKLEAATNIPGEFKWFAHPRAKRKDFPQGDSILILPSEVTLGLPQILQHKTKRA